MTDLTDIVLRLGGATLIGVRTLGLVGLASATAVVAAMPHGIEDANSLAAASRVMQGVLTGIGFLGAGVIVRRDVGKAIHGLTSAACAWTTACLGLVCGLGAWQIVATGAVLVFVLLIFGGPFERMSHRRLGPIFDRVEEGAAAGSGAAGSESNNPGPAGPIDPQP
jgi:putative Mg2+ transporter-C (MgtC) family protein